MHYRLSILTNLLNILLYFLFFIVFLAYLFSLIFFPALLASYRCSAKNKFFAEFFRFLRKNKKCGNHNFRSRIFHILKKFTLFFLCKFTFRKQFFFLFNHFVNTSIIFFNIFNICKSFNSIC